MPDLPSPSLPMRLTRKEKIASDIFEFEFRKPDGGTLPEFTPGAHLALITPAGHLRKYSLCNECAERDRYVIAVKCETPGRGGSNSLINDAKAGDEIKIAAPVNDFELPRNAQNFLFVAGGIGITPIMAMIRHLRSVEGKSFRLFYLTREPEMTAFRD